MEKFFYGLSGQLYIRRTDFFGTDWCRLKIIYDKKSFFEEDYISLTLHKKFFFPFSGFSRRTTFRMTILGKIIFPFIFHEILLFPKSWHWKCHLFGEKNLKRMSFRVYKSIIFLLTQKCYLFGIKKSKRLKINLIVPFVNSKMLKKSEKSISRKKEKNLFQHTKTWNNNILSLIQNLLCIWF